MKDSLVILARDPHYLVIDKPPDLLAVPGRGPDQTDCAVNRARSLFPDLPHQPAVHRLDQQTSGLMLLARSAGAYRALSRQFQHRLVDKCYTAILEGQVDGQRGIIELAFRLDPENRPRQIYDPVNGKPGITLWRRISVESRRTRILFTPLTGRTHQLRLHAAHPSGLGLPIAGDRLYGSGSVADTLLLHACFLRFNHPVSGRIMEYHSPVPF